MNKKPLPYHPKAGEVLRCDYSGLVAPEMDKVRWAVVISPKFLNRPNLCTVVPLSTTAPLQPQAHHVLLSNDPDPHPSGDPVWAKCDMLMTVSYYRLTKWWEGKTPDGKRNYVTIMVSGQDLGRITEVCTLQTQR